jgi:hybrid cluster-associated redox disulfide protein
MKKQKTKQEQLITKGMMLGELVDRFPEAAMMLAIKGMHCVGCGMAGSETIEQGCKAHGMSDEEIDKLIREMNGKVSGKKK